MQERSRSALDQGHATLGLNVIGARILDFGVGGVTLAGGECYSPDPRQDVDS